MTPLSFRPILKRLRWGGRRLGERLGKPIGGGSDYAESWEIADHGDDRSVVADGPFEGWTLARLVAERNAELFGRHAGLRQFPLLVKFLDATDRLSVQVHPDDARAKAFDPRENGKSEAWVVLDAEPGSVLFAGLRPGVTAERLRAAAEAGTVESLLHSFPVAPGECVYVPAGTVHAIGEGVLLAEIQQASDLTFRLYDWGRAGADGKPRALHVEQATACADFESGPVTPVTPRRTGHGAGATDDLVRCGHFAIRRHVLTGGHPIAADGRFRVLTAVAGDAEIDCGGETRPFGLGRTLLVPAASPEVTVRPRAGEVTILESFLP